MVALDSNGRRVKMEKALTAQEVRRMRMRCDSHVSVKQGVTAIGNYTFHDCVGLTSIALPDGVTAIGEYAFRNQEWIEIACYWKLS